jgi:hypothetical protein
MSKINYKNNIFCSRSFNDLFIRLNITDINNTEFYIEFNTDGFTNIIEKINKIDEIIDYINFLETYKLIITYRGELGFKEIKVKEIKLLEKNIKPTLFITITSQYKRIIGPIRGNILHDFRIIKPDK